MNKKELINLLNNYYPKSKWDKGVKDYCFELLDVFEDGEEFPADYNELKNKLLNGAHNWDQFSWGGCSLCYDVEICERLATPSEQKKKDYGRLQPNSRENWLDVQRRALKQAFYLLYKIVNNIR